MFGIYEKYTLYLRCNLLLTILFSFLGQHITDTKCWEENSGPFQSSEGGWRIQIAGAPLLLTWFNFNPSMDK